jgi:hypothetical protein
MHYPLRGSASVWEDDQGNPAKNQDDAERESKHHP